MKIYKILTTLLVVLISCYTINLQAQKNYSAVADQAFKNNEYYDALPLYKKAYSKVKSSEKAEKARLMFQLAECYRLTNDYANAHKWYDRAIGRYKDNIVLYYDAQMLRNMQKYDDAIAQYKAYIQKAPNDPRGKMGLESCELAKKLKDNPSRYQVKEMKAFNSKQSDYGVAFIEQKRFTQLMFTSSRESSVGKGTDAWTGESFSDIYVSRKDRKGQWGTPQTLGKPINTEMSEGAPCLNRKATELYFTRCPREKKKKENCQIYNSQLKGIDWDEPKIQKLVPDSFSAGHPFISDDELSLYFSSDLQPGGLGGKDIWVAKRSSKTDKWGKPENLGNTINTNGDEMFPFLRTNGDLYFSSNGFPGMGGLDIFKAPKKDKSWGTPVDLIPPINSSSDDFAIVFMGDDERGFFSSNRTQKTGDDIFYFWLPNLLYTLSGTVKDDSTKMPIFEALVKVTDSDGKAFEGKTNKEGLYKFDTIQIQPNKTYNLLFTKEPEYFAGKGQATTVGLDQSKDLTLNKNLIPIPKKPIELPEILYDLNKWDLKPQYQDSLNGLYQTLVDNPKLVIELASHCDPRASDEHNDTLSNNRAKSVVDYLIGKGIDPERMVAKGYGKRVPRVLKKNTSYTINGKKYSFKKGTELTEKYILAIKEPDQREAAYTLDRRTEFSILRRNFVPKPKQESAPKPEENIKKDEGKTIPPVKLDTIKPKTVTPILPVKPKKK